jgi:hypothetical protein
VEKQSLVFNLLSKESVKKQLEKWVVYLSFFFFIGHLGLILLRNLYPDVAILQPLSANYLSALYTPFSIILVYEVYLLILALPLSFTNSIRKQYEIISLIIIRNVFKDISMFDDFDQLLSQTDVIIQIAADLGSGLLLFFLVGVFYHISLKRPKLTYLTDLQVKNFVYLKERIAILLMVIFTSLTVYSVYTFGDAIYQLVYFDQSFTLDLGIIFFVEFYTVMIFSDVFIFIASFMFSQTYSRLLRNAGFVCSTVILRISLSAEPEISGLLAAVAVITGILSQLIYVYFTSLEKRLENDLNED